MRTPAAGTRRAPDALARPARAAVVALGLAFAAPAGLTGCAGRPPVPEPPAPPPAARPAPGYGARVDSLESVDGRAVAGRRIAIDPGHGGIFRGSIGVNGTTEAEVNLGVALRLRELLVARGAEVFLTRATDRDFVTPADSSLRADLAERVRLANAFAPDVFVSVHHNADAGGRHDVNETQTYYKLGDEGPSYDLANDVHRALVRNVGIDTQRLLPGNFFVVRESGAPALLTEGSYLTNPDVEARLRTPEAQQLEAEAIYLGIARYFMRRVPVVDSVWVETRLDERGHPLAQGDTRHAIHARVRGDFDHVAVRVDGVALAPGIAGGRVSALTAGPLAAGRHEAVVSARLAGEGSSPPLRHAFEVTKPAHVVLEAGIPMADAAPSRAALPLRIRALDWDFLPRPDTVAIRLRVLAPRGVQPRDTVVHARDGVAWAYFRWPGPTSARNRLQVTMEVASDSAAAEPPQVFASGAPLPLDTPGERTGFALRLPAGTRLENAPGTTGPAPRLSWINRDGFVALRAGPAGTFRAPRLAGFRAWGPDTAWPPRYVALAEGALAGRRIVLDPEGGGDDDAGAGPSGTRAAALNLEVARALAAMLEAAGAEVRLTREGDASVPEVARVQLSEGFRAERYLRIGHAAAPPVAGHYFSSAGGRRWAARVADAMLALGLADSLPVAESAKYALAQVSATALYASLGRLDDPLAEARLLAPGRSRAEAFALFLALARDFAPAEDWDVHTIEVSDGAGRPVPGALVTLGGALVLQADGAGIVRFVRTETGPLEATCEDSRVGARIVLLESARRHLLSGMR